MDLRDYLRHLGTEEARAEFAARCDISVGHLRNHAYGTRQAGAALCVALERESAGAMRRWDLRPNDWHLIWPELVGAAGAPELKQAA